MKIKTKMEIQLGKETIPAGCVIEVSEQQGSALIGGGYAVGFKVPAAPAPEAPVAEEIPEAPAEELPAAEAEEVPAFEPGEIPAPVAVEPEVKTDAPASRKKKKNG
jgi:hypothetical protein